MTRETTPTLVADEEYPSPDLLDPSADVSTMNLVAISDDAIPVRAVDDERLAVIAVRVGAEFFAPLLDGKTDMNEMSAQTGLDLDIVRAAILRLAVQGAVTFVKRRQAGDDSAAPGV
jgi:hypothetical protein